MPIDSDFRRFKEEWDAEELFTQCEPLFDRHPIVSQLFDEHYNEANELKVFLDIIEGLVKIIEED